MHSSSVQNLYHIRKVREVQVAGINCNTLALGLAQWVKLSNKGRVLLDSVYAEQVSLEVSEGRGVH